MRRPTYERDDRYREEQRSHSTWKQSDMLHDKEGGVETI